MRNNWREYKRGERLRAVFMGTPRFSVDIAEALAAAHDIVAVFTRAPKPAGRGQILEASPVQRWAEERGIPVAHTFAGGLPEADIGIVAAYGVILKTFVLTGFPLGCVNVHASLLPRWRGAAPIERALMAGDAATGVTIMQMAEGLDTGDMLKTAEITILDTDTTDTLTDKLAAVGGEALIAALRDRPEPQPQPPDGATYAAKIAKTEGLLTPDMPAEAAARQIRAIPSWIERDGERIKIIAAHVENGRLVYDILQRPGRKPVLLADFLRGWHGSL
ncbi:methionyl-tRNA formyltransferase [Alphaproteobacteria bacterium]|nr:methionyl-tRNA formyltransferase [Alphaproteobacteria bacterium]